MPEATEWASKNLCSNAGLHVYICYVCLFDGY